MRKTQVSKQRPFLGVKMRPAEQLTPAAPLGVAVGEVELREDPGHQIDVKPPRLDLSSTLAFMQFRKVFRYHRGSYVKARPIVLLILFWCLGCLTLFDSCKVIYTDDGTFVSLPTDLWTGQNEVLFALAFLVVAAYWQLKLMYQYSLKLLVPMLSMSVVGQSIAILVEYFQQRDDEDSQIAGTIAFAYIIVSTFYIACVAIARVVFPYIAQSRRYAPVILMEKEDPDMSADMQFLLQNQEDEQPISFGSFLYKGPFWWNTRVTCKYSGAVNDKGQPHGFGVWADDHPLGETLEGMWDNGYPVGPFKARETGSGSGFQRMRVGFFTCRNEDIKTIACMPRVAPYSVGIGSVECCVSGAFFHEHPLLKIEWEEMDLASGDDLNSSISKMLNGMVTLDQETLAQKEPPTLQIYADINRGITVSGFSPESGEVQTSLTITIPRAEDGSGPFLAGYSSVPLVNAMYKQTEELSPRSPHFHRDHELDNPVFPTTAENTGTSIGGKGGQSPRKFRKMQSMKLGITRQVAQKRYRAPEFEQRLQLPGWLPQEGCHGAEVLIHIHGYNSACQHGLKNVAQLWTFANFPSYIKPVVFSWPTGSLMAYPYAQTKGAENDCVALALREFIISLASQGVRDFHFQTHSMGARMLMHAIPFIEDLFNRPLNGRTHAEATSDEHMATDVVPSRYAGSLKMVNVILMNPEYGMHQFVQMRAKILERLCDITTVYGDVKDAALMFSYVMNNLQSKLMAHHRKKSWLPREVTASQPCRCIWKQRDTCLGLHIYDAKDSNGKPIKVDMIDCTFLQANVQGGRHNTFTLNRSVIEDIYDVVVNRRPAIQRSNRLEPRGGNVYSFLVAPSHIVAP